ncbi:MAG TPA: hypothetical protein VIK33_07590 [Anaerolineae bacterium]
MAAPGQVLRGDRLTPGELYRRHVQRKKVVALIAGLLLLPLSLMLIVAYDRGPLGQAVSQFLGFSVSDGQRPGITPTTGAIAQVSPTVGCLDTVFNGLVADAETGALLGGVRVTTSFGARVETSPDGEYNILVCYDPTVHDGFSLVFEKEGYESGSLDVVTSAYPGVSFQIPDMMLYSVQVVTPTPTLFEPPRQTPLPTPAPTLFQPPRQTPLPTSAASTGGSNTTPTLAPTPGSGGPAPTDVEPTIRPPNTLPNTGVPQALFPGQAIGLVLLAISLMLIVAGLWPADETDR